MPRSTPLACLLLALSLATSGRVLGSILEVPTHFPTIQQAVNAAGIGDEIVILPGTYLENVVITGATSLIIRGWADAASTIVDGDFRDPVFRIESCHRVALRTLTIRQGRIGVKVTSSGPVQIADTIIEDNVSLGDGGGIWILDSEMLIEDNQILNNRANTAQALDGGGIFFHASSGVISGNRIEGNHAHEGAGIIVNVSTNPSLLIAENLLIDNHATLFGGGIFVNRGTDPEIRSNTVVGNVTTSAGGAVFYMPESKPLFGRNIIVGNSASDGGGFHAFGPAAPTFVCNDTWENTGGNYTGAIIDPTGTDGNISLDPLFCRPEAGDYSLAQNSPCAPGHSPPGCDLIGAVPVGCGPVAVEPATWGGIKSIYSPAAEEAQ